MSYVDVGLVAVVLLSSACLMEPGDDLDDADRVDQALSGWQTVGPLPGDSDLSVPPRAEISFGSDWMEHANKPLFHGASVGLSVDPSRFPSCGTDGTVRAGLADSTGAIEEVVLDGGEPGRSRWGEATLPLEGEDLQIWLWVETDDGCIEYDSDFEQNYRFPLVNWHPIRVRFDADWSEHVEGTLVPGATLVVDYDWDRLPDCRVIYRGFPGWEILAHVRFDTGPDLPAQSVTRNGGWTDPGVTPVLAVFPIPVDAHSIELWFENDQYPPTCHSWDSNWGQNYRFDF